MPLHVVESACERLVSPALVELLRDACDGGGAAVLLVPSFVQALDAQKALAHEGLSLGVAVTTVESWARGRWEVWGTGARVVTPDAAAVLMCEALASARSAGVALPPHRGTVRLLCQLARRALPWLPHDGGASGAQDVAASPLSPAERDALRVIDAYRRALRRHGLVEESEAMALVPARLAAGGVRVPPMAVAGFAELTRAQGECVVALAALTDVTAFVDVGAPAGTVMADQLSGWAQGHGVTCDRVHASGEGDVPPRRTSEFDALVRRLYGTGAMRPVVPTGSVRLLEPAGPIAEAELVAREVLALVPRATSVVLVAGDVRRWWRELAPKLTARGVSVRAQLSLPFAQTEAGRAFLGYVRTVSDLAQRAASWPAAVETPEGERRSLGAMDWWPPRRLTDFLLSDLAHVDHGKAVRLDAAWRGDRLLGPGDVLEALLSARATSIPVERATRELLRGRLGSAASKLLAGYADGGGSPEGDGAGQADARAHATPCADGYAVLEAKAALGAVLSVSGTLRELGISADPADESPVSLAELVDTALVALEATSVTLRPQAGAPGATCTVSIMSPAQAELLAPASADVVVACGLTSDEWPLMGRESLPDDLLAALGVERQPDRARRSHLRWHRIVSASGRALVLERTLVSADASPRWPSPLLQDVLDRYGTETLPVEALGEDEAVAALDERGVAPALVARETLVPAGRVGAAGRELVIVPPEGVPELADGLPLLSASQIESYLECPYKWFSLRRLSLRDADAACGPLETGTFVHRVLELAHRQLLGEALSAHAAAMPHEAGVLAGLAGIAPDGGEAAGPPPRPTADELRSALAMRLAGADAAWQGRYDLARAHEVVRAVFDQHLAHQYLQGATRGGQRPLIAHTARERLAVERLRDDLETTFDFESERLLGFEPRLFEWGFGGRRAPMTYAGARIVGTVDRVDVDAHGQVVVVDYKHKRPAGFAAEYDAFDKGGCPSGVPPTLPRRVQALVYAQVVRRAFPGLRVVGALYLGTHDRHELAGAASAHVADRLLGPSASRARLAGVSVPDGEDFGVDAGPHGLEAFLDCVEHEIARRIDELREGNIEARPVDAAACGFCPVARCERRLSR